MLFVIVYHLFPLSFGALFSLFLFYFFILFFSPQSFVLLFYFYPPRIALLIVGNIIRPFPSSTEPLYQNKVKCSAFDMEITFHSRANKTHFYKKGFALGLILKVRVFGSRKYGSLFTSNKLSLLWSRENAIPPRF